MIEAKNLTKRFGSLMAVDHINAQILDGSVFGLIGTNGAGKSTFLRMLSGVLKPDEGSVTIDGKEVYENVEVKSRFFYISDDQYFFSNSTPGEMAAYYGKIYERFDQERFHKLMSIFGLDEKRKIRTFSKGMKKQVSVICGVCAGTDYLFCDETFDGLDPVMRNLVKSMICQDVLERGATAIITSHSLRELEDTCDQLALLHQGGIVLESDIQDLKTSLFKVQIAFPCEYDREFFRDIDVVHFSKRGSVANLIVRGDREETAARLQRMQPSVLDILPLTLEEVVTYEMEALGYAFGDLLPQ